MTKFHPKKIMTILSIQQVENLLGLNVVKIEMKPAVRVAHRCVDAMIYGKFLAMEKTPIKHIAVLKR